MEGYAGHPACVLSTHTLEGVLVWGVSTPFRCSPALRPGLLTLQMGRLEISKGKTPVSKTSVLEEGSDPRALPPVISILDGPSPRLRALWN